jgi:hypothetical protein
LGQAFPDDSLVVRRNVFPVGSDFVLNHKELLTRSLVSMLKEIGETRVFCLPMTRVPMDVQKPRVQGLPNLVYKYPESMAGAGVFFLHARDREHALSMARELDRVSGEPPGLFQPFRCSLLREGRRVFDVRAEIFVSPLETRYLTSFMRVSSQSVPSEFPEGVFPSKGVFTSNFSTGGTLHQVEENEKTALIEAAMAVGGALRRILERTFRTHPGRRGTGTARWE